MEITKEGLQALIKEGVEEVLGSEPPEEKPIRAKEEETPREKGSGEEEVTGLLDEAKRIAEQAKITACGSLLNSKLEASKLPQDFQKVVRSQFESRVFEAKELDAAIKGQADAIAAPHPHVLQAAGDALHAVEGDGIAVFAAEEIEQRGIAARRCDIDEHVGQRQRRKRAVPFAGMLIMGGPAGMGRGLKVHIA